MFRLKHILNNISAIACTNDIVTYISSQSEIFVNQEIINIDNFDRSSLFSLNQKYIVLYDLEKGYNYLFSNEYKFKNWLIHSGNLRKILIASSSPKRISRGVYARNILLIDKKSFKTSNIILKDYIGNVLFYFDDCFLTKRTNLFLELYDIDGRKYWDFDISQFGTY